MTDNCFSPTMRVQIELALLAQQQGGNDALVDQARRLGLTGAEIDAARRGASFNAITDVAVKLALAMYDDNDDMADNLKRKLQSFGSAGVISHVLDTVEAWRKRP